MSDADFNMSMRKFLKQVGVTSQQEIEAAIRRAQADGTLPAGGIRIKAVISSDEIGLTHIIEDKITPAGDA